MELDVQRPNRSQQLIRLASARAALQTAEDFQEIRKVRDEAESIRADAKRTALGIDLQNYAAELKLQAERRGGKLLSDLKLRGGNRINSRLRRKPLRLSDLGIDKNLSARWQIEASVPEPAFREFVRSHFQNRREISSSALIAVGRRLREERVEDLIVTSESALQVATTSHLVELDVDTLESDGPRLNDLNALVSETRNHYELLFSLVVDLLQKAACHPTTLEYRSITRYLNEVNRHLIEISETLANIEHNATFASI